MMAKLIDASDLKALLLAKLNEMRQNHAEYDIEYVDGYMEALGVAMQLAKELSENG